MLAATDCQPESASPLFRFGTYCTLDARKGPAGSRLGHSATNQDPTRQLDVDRLLDRALGPREFDLADQVRLAIGRMGAQTEVVAGRRVGCEPAMEIGAKSGDRPATVEASTRGNVDDGTRYRLPRVSGNDTSLDDRRGLNYHRGLRRRVLAVGLYLHPLPRETVVTDFEADGEVTANAREREPSFSIRGDGLRPRVQTFEAVVPERNAIVRSELGGPAHAADPQLDSGCRLTVQVDELAANELFGLEPNLRRGRTRVGIQLGPAEPESRGGGDRIHLEEASRRGAGRFQSEAAVGVWLPCRPAAHANSHFRCPPPRACAGVR